MKMDAAEIERLVAPMLLHPLPESALELLSRYVQLLYRWNERMNLTAVREPAVLVRLHIGECLRAAQLIPEGITAVLDFGSGAGLPGIPMQIARPELAVTLADSQTKKAGFLREAVRELGLTGATVVSGRVEDLPEDRLFDLVAMRAVDRMERALPLAAKRVRAGGTGMVLTSEGERQSVAAALPGWSWTNTGVPQTEQRVILVGRMS